MYPEKNPFLQVAVEAAKAAEAVIRRYYNTGVKVNLKQDSSPVTVADIESEREIIGVISRAFPAHGFFGEETGKHKTEAEYLWLIDPIDGTKSFIRGTPFFSTQIALMHKGHLIAGVSNAFMFNELAYAAAGEGAYLNDERIAVSTVKSLDAATLSAGNIGNLAVSAAWPAMGKLINAINRFRGYGDFLHYHLLAAGKLDCVIETGLSILDIAALTVIVREAGGIFTDLSGEEINLGSTSVLAAATPELHKLILNRLQYP
ncbi:MAG TPA: inositol monophosphatase family protein [Gammaproteobacteria bacterium]